jgi:hypothetical protein
MARISAKVGVAQMSAHLNWALLDRKMVLKVIKEQWDTAKRRENVVCF